MVNPKNDANSLKTKIRFNQKPIAFALDTGSDVNVIDEDSHVEAGSPPIKKCTELEEPSMERRFDSSGKASAHLNLEEYSSKMNYFIVFEDALGHCIKEKAHLELKGGAASIYQKPITVPHNSKDVIERELDRLEGLGIIRKVEHLDWAAPILVVKKTDVNARLCIDYSTGLNDALIDYQHPLPIPEDILRR
ncbi:hypothetical protein niasHS_017562 [Heterodera schachtii]|uniref:Peptidase A2 domain-containing protein n=2 Tax=Heterodera TaxID=34509 RepID=A0ABD2IH44_HETSC